MGQFDELRQGFRRYVKIRLDGIKLAWVENLSTFIGKAFGVLLAIGVVFIGFVFLMVALSLWLGQLIGSFALGFLISGLFFFILGAVFYMLRDRLVTDALVRNFSEMFFKNDNNDEQQADE